MSLVKGRLVPATIAGAVLASGAFAFADAETEQLQEQIRALQTRLNALEAKSASTAAVHQEVLKDAQARSDLSPVLAGYQKGKFIIQSEDGKFSLNPQLQFQPRYVANVESGDGDDEDGFEVRRLKLGFAGNAVTKDLTYNFVWATDHKNGSFKLEDAWLRYQISKPWSVFGGQFKDFWTHEATVGSKRALAVDASLLNQVLGEGQTGYVQGIGLGWQNDRVRTQVAFHDGARSGNTNYQDYATDSVTGRTTGSNFGGSVRGEWLAVGDNWKQYDDFSALGNKADLLVLGAGADLTQLGSDDFIYHTVDAQWEPAAVGGLSVYGALVARQFEGEDSVYDSGALAQVGYLFTPRWEVFGRYDITQLDVVAPGAEDTFHEITGGVNYYINGHNAKVSLDLTYLPNGAPAKTDGLGFADSDEEQIVARAQLQLLL